MYSNYLVLQKIYQIPKSNEYIKDIIDKPISVVNCISGMKTQIRGYMEKICDMYNQEQIALAKLNLLKPNNQYIIGLKENNTKLEPYYLYPPLCNNKFNDILRTVSVPSDVQNRRFYVFVQASEMGKTKLGFSIGFKKPTLIISKAIQAEKYAFYEWFDCFFKKRSEIVTFTCFDNLIKINQYIVNIWIMFYTIIFIELHSMNIFINEFLTVVIGSFAEQFKNEKVNYLLLKSFTTNGGIYNTEMRYYLNEFISHILISNDFQENYNKFENSFIVYMTFNEILKPSYLIFDDFVETSNK